MRDTHITGRHIGGGTHITSDMCAGIHISRGYTYHCDTGLPCQSSTHSTPTRGKVERAWVYVEEDFSRVLHSVELGSHVGRISMSVVFVRRWLVAFLIAIGIILIVALSLRKVSFSFKVMLYFSCLSYQYFLM